MTRTKTTAGSKPDWRQRCCCMGNARSAIQKQPSIKYTCFSFVPFSVSACFRFLACFSCLSFFSFFFTLMKAKQAPIRRMRGCSRQENKRGGTKLRFWLRSHVWRRTHADIQAQTNVFHLLSYLLDFDTLTWRQLSKPIQPTFWLFASINSVTMRKVDKC